MPDINLSQVVDAVPQGSPVRAWLEGLPPLPPGVTMSNFLEQVLTAAAIAQDNANQLLPQGQKIGGYIAPRYTSTQYDGKGNIVVRGVASIDFVKVLPAHNAVTAPILGR